MVYVRNWLHCVWATKKRAPLITAENKNKILAHIYENAMSKGIHIRIINANNEHIHCLLSLSANQALAIVMQIIKGESSYWINKHSLCEGRFEWADEYYAASICESHVDKVKEYIINQEEYHSRRTFEQEYNEIFTHALCPPLGEG